MNEELNKALEQISDDHLNEAAAYRRKGFPWMKSIAAVLALVIAWPAIWAAFDFSALWLAVCSLVGAVACFIRQGKR